MAKLLTVVSVVNFSIPAHAAPLPTATLTPSQQAVETRSLDDVIAWLHSVTTLVADFKQTTSSGKVSHGKMTLARPGKVRFEYEPSVPVLVVAMAARCLWSITAMPVCSATRLKIRRFLCCLIPSGYPAGGASGGGRTGSSAGVYNHRGN